jgi:hypothetical protein
MNRKFCYLLVLPFIFLSVSCSDSEAPKDLIPENRYVDIFSQLVVINQITDEQLGEVSRDSLITQVFEQQGVSRDQFNRSHQYYQRQPDRQLQRVKRVEEKLKNERDEFQERLNEKRRAIRDTAAVTDTL